MKLTKITDGSSLTLKIEGWLDTATAPELYKTVKTELEGITDLIFDMSELSYISSAGLRVLLSAQKIMNKQGRMTVTNICESVSEVFKMTGFDRLLNIE